MPNLLLPAAILLDKTYRGREDALASLPGLYRSGGEAAAVADSLDVEEEGHGGGAGEEEVAVAGVREEVVGDCLLRGGEGLSDDGAAIDAAGAWGMP